MPDVRVNRCPASLRVAAMRCLEAATPSDQREGLAFAIDQAWSCGEVAWDGLFVVGSGEPQAAIWVQVQPGNTAYVWPPAAEDAAALLRAAAAHVDQQGIALAQINVAAGAGYDHTLMAAAGFPHLADLLYLYVELGGATRDSSPRANALKFIPNAGEEAERLAALLVRTYVGTLDCPALEGVRSMDDVLAGYKTQGEYLADHWYFVCDEGIDIGVLLLASHAAVGNWELVYVGIVPEARGRRYGQHVVQRALAAASRGGAQRMVLAVDAANQPAVDMYRHAGFVEWDRRSVFARLAGRASVST